MKTIQKNKKKINKKALSFIVVGILAMSLIVAAVVWSYNISITAHVNEAFSSTTMDLDFSGIVGNTITQNINIYNSADVPITANLIWSETSNTNGVIYTMNIPPTYEVQPGDNVIPIAVTYDTISPVGDIAGNLTLTRGTA